MEIEMIYKNWAYPDREPFNGMVSDLWRGIQAQENYLVALGLFAYSEVLGRMILGSVGKSGSGCCAFRKFTEEYVEYKFEDWYKIFDYCRNGLAHEYFIKKNGNAVYNDNGDAPCGIVKNNEIYEIRIHSYFKHFVKGLEKAIESGELSH